MGWPLTSTTRAVESAYSRETSYYVNTTSISEQSLLTLLLLQGVRSWTITAHSPPAAGCEILDNHCSLSSCCRLWDPKQSLLTPLLLQGVRSWTITVHSLPAAGCEILKNHCSLFSCCRVWDPEQSLLTLLLLQDVRSWTITVHSLPAAGCEILNNHCSLPFCCRVWDPGQSVLNFLLLCEILNTECSLNFPGGLLIDILHSTNQMGGTDGTDVVRRVSRASLLGQHVHPPGRGWRLCLHQPGPSPGGHRVTVPTIKFPLWLVQIEGRWTRKRILVLVLIQTVKVKTNLH